MMAAKRISAKELRAKLTMTLRYSTAPYTHFYYIGPFTCRAFASAVPPTYRRYILLYYHDLNARHHSNSDIPELPDSKDGSSKDGNE
jgi:hypothetical protein